MSLVAALAAVFVIGGCSNEVEPPATSVMAEQAPEAVVVALMEAIGEGRFEDTPVLTDSMHAGLLTLAEGAGASDILEVLEEGGEAVTANFWSGFAQTLENDFQSGGINATTADAVTEGGYEYTTVTLASEGGNPQAFVVRRNGSWRIDLMATFGPVLAERLIAPVEALLSSANADAATVLSRLSQSAPSLRYAASRADLPPEVHQSLLGLIERVTRSG